VGEGYGEVLGLLGGSEKRGKPKTEGASASRQQRLRGTNTSGVLRAAMGDYLSWVGSQTEDQTREMDSLFITAAFAWQAFGRLVVKGYGI